MDDLLDLNMGPTPSQDMGGGGDLLDLGMTPDLSTSNSVPQNKEPIQNQVPDLLGLNLGGNDLTGNSTTLSHTQSETGGGLDLLGLGMDTPQE